MKIFTEIIAAEPSSNTEALAVDLNYDQRKRARLKITVNSGETVGIQIERGQILRDKTYLTNTDGDTLCIRAMAEAVSSAYIAEPLLFARACYHLGNRHVPLQIGEQFLRYQTDYVLDAMLEGLGVTVLHEQQTFEPENGAYMTGAAHGHSHSHSHDEDSSEAAAHHHH